MDQKQKERNFNPRGMLLGLLIGIGIALALDNIPIGVGVGVALGAGFSTVKRPQKEDSD
jgi:hypothetical protein